MLTDCHAPSVMLTTDINRNIQISLPQMPSAPPAMTSPTQLSIPTITFDVADIDNNNDPTIDNCNQDQLNNNNNIIRDSVDYNGNNNDSNNNNLTQSVNVTTYTIQNNGNNNNNNILCLSNDIINIDDIPISVIRSKCRQLLSTHLNPIKVILSEDGVPRDYRGVLHWLGLETVNVTLLQTKNDPMGELLTLWIKERKEMATMGQLHNILGSIDRWDVVDDTSDFFVEDAKIYLSIKAKQQQHNQNVIVRDEAEQPNATNSMTIFNPEANILTIDDAALAQQGLPPQQYDAFVLFADEDIDFATEIINKMEESGFKLCVKERDLIGGSFQHEAILRMISERCERLIVVLSPAFLNSAANSFFVNFAQALGVEQRQRKIIPCMFEACKLPLSLTYYCTLVYKRSEVYNRNFWDRLKQSIQKNPSQIIVNNMSAMPRITITEIDAPAAIKPAVRQPPQSQKAILQNSRDAPVPTNDTVKAGSRKRKEKTPSPKSSNSKSGSKSSLPTTPTGLKQFWPPSPKLRANISSSMWTLAVEDNTSLDKENKHCRSTLSLNSPSSSPSTLLYKKPKWYKKLLSPNSGSLYKLSADSDSTVDNSAEKSRKKKKWYKRKFGSRTKMRERELAKEI